MNQEITEAVQLNKEHYMKMTSPAFKVKEGWIYLHGEKYMGNIFNSNAICQLLNKGYEECERLQMAHAQKIMDKLGI